MTAGQEQAAMIALLARGHCLRRIGLNFGAFAQRATAGGTPVGHSLFVEDCVAVAADAFHTFKITGSGRLGLFVRLKLCTLPFGWWQSIWMGSCCRPLRRRLRRAWPGRYSGR